ncbi:MAG: carboxypeptidase-like regulatory domain-containing protein [Acidobacteriaceae bacterium]
MKCTVPLLLLGLGYSISFGQPVRPDTLHRDNSLQFGIVDCFGQGKMHASRIRGMVFDPTGVPVPGAKVLLTSAERYLAPDAKPAFQTETDQAGRFFLKAKSGDYVLDVKSQSFVSPQVQIDLGSDLVGFVHPDNLYVMLGLSGSFCAWVTGSHREFEHEAQLNRAKLQGKSH